MARLLAIMLSTHGSTLLNILLIGILAPPILAKTLLWSLYGVKSVGDLEPVIKQDPVSVNLATAMQAVAVAWPSRYMTERVLQVTDTQATVKVQKSGGTQETQEITVKYGEAGSRFCSLETERPPVWPCVVGTAISQAGWSITEPMTVPDALYAITGHEVKTQYSVYSNTDSSTTRANFKHDKLDPIQGFIAVMVTKKEHTVNDLKKNYAYAVVPNPIKPSELIFDDPDSNAADMLTARWSADNIFDAVEYVYYIEGCNSSCSDWRFP